MAEKLRKLTVAYMSISLASLDVFWEWNAGVYGRHHADKYIGFLQAATDKLETDFPLGKSVPIRPGMRHRVLRRKPRGYGHVVVYESLRNSLSSSTTFTRPRIGMRNLGKKASSWGFV